MLDNTITLEAESIDDIEPPALATGSAMFWKDDSGEWQDVTVIDCDPIGWGWCNIEWTNYDGTHKFTKSVPIVSLSDLDERLKDDTYYSAFELANAQAEYQYQRSAGARGYTY